MNKHYAKTFTKRFIRHRAVRKGTYKMALFGILGWILLPFMLLGIAFCCLSIIHFQITEWISDSMKF